MRHTTKMISIVKLQVFYMRKLSEEVRGYFTGDMGFVADYLNEGSFANRKNQKIVHVEALCRMMQALTRDSRFVKQVEALIKKQEGGKEITMCKYIDMLEAKGRKEGREEGRKEGREEGRKEGRKKGREEGRKEGRKEGREEGWKEGRKEGRAEEIVESSYESGLTEADILGKLQKKLNISLQTAQKYLKRFGREMA